MNKIELNLSADLKTFLTFLYQKSLYSIPILLISSIFAYFINIKINPVYIANAVIALEKDEQKHANRNLMFDTFNKDNSINNEIFILKSYDFLKRINNLTNNNVRYYKQYFNLLDIRYLTFYSEIDPGNPFFIYDLCCHLFTTDHLPLKYTLKITEDKKLYLNDKLIDNESEYKIDKENCFKIKILKYTPGTYFFTIDDEKTTIKRIMDNLQINKVAKDSSAIKLEFKDYTEGRALNFLKLYLLGYSKEYNKRQNLETDSKLEQLRKQKNDLEKELNDAMSKVAVFQVDNNLMAPDVIGKSETELVLNNQEKFFETQVNKLQIEKALRLINEDKYGEITNYGIFSDNINIQNLLKDLITLKSEKDALLVDYTENHPSVIAKSNKIKAIKNEIQNYLERNLENNAIISDNLKKNIDKKIRTLQTLPKNKLILDSLQQKMTINNKLLATLIEEEATLLIDKKGENSEFKIIEEPRIIYPPLKASATLIYLESLAVGMIIYFFLALILYKMEKRLYGINQIIRHMSVSKYFSVFENEINVSNDKIKKIINLLLIETEYNDKNTYFIFSDNNKISQKIAFFIFKISMKKTITVDLDNCIQTLRAVILNKSLHSSHLIKDENTIENYRFMKFDVLEEHHEDEYINISALKEILYASFENIIFITTKEMRYIQPEDYVILNVWQKITSLHFIHDLTEYFQQKKIKNTFLVFFNWQPHSSAIKSQLVKFGTRNIFPLLCLTPFIFSGCQTKNNFLETNGTIYKQYIYEEYKLKKGDRLAVSFYKKGEAKDGLPEPYNGITPFIVSTIKEDGSITLPLIGRSELEGLTLEKAEEMLCERFKFYYRNPVVALELQDAKIFVLGEVNNPGVVKINSARVNLVEAIASAGDFNTASNKKNIKIIKDINTNPSIAEVDLTQMNNFAGSNIFLNPSDVVYVSSTNVQIFNDKFTETFPFLNMVNQALDAALSRKNITRP